MLSQRNLQSRRRLLLALGGAGVTLAFTACRRGGRTDAPPQRWTSTAPIEHVSPAPSKTSGSSTPTLVEPLTTYTGPSGEALPLPVQHALLRAALDHAVSPAEAVLISYIALDWPSPALGCPEEGRLYPQVVTPGFRVSVSVSGQTVDYHTDRATTVVRCPSTDA